MIAAPPVLAGAVHETVEEAFWLAVAVTVRGWPGTVETRVEAEATEASPVPEALVAVTWKV